MEDLAKLVRLMILAQRQRRDNPTTQTLLHVKKVEQEVVNIVKEILDIEELTDEPR